jgi:hypothetical protein
MPDQGGSTDGTGMMELEDPGSESYAAQRKKLTDHAIQQIMAVIVIIGVPSFITLWAVRTRPDAHFVRDNPTPYGYTISLLLFLSPVMTMAWQLLKNPSHAVHRRALFWATGTITLIGFVLDLIFGYSFFTFKNTGAVLGYYLPAWSWGQMAWVPSYLPIEEFAFYILGSLFMLTTYLWIEWSWLEDEVVMDRRNGAKRVEKLIEINPKTFVAWVVAIIAGVLYKRYLGVEEGFAGYYLFIMVLGFLPTVLFLNGIQNFVNWRAFSIAYGILMFVELMWEVTLAIPFDWWNYQGAQMLGIRSRAWHGLPLEAALLWIVVAWDCIIAFELFRVYFHMDAESDEGVTVKHALFGKKKDVLKSAA